MYFKYFKNITVNFIHRVEPFKDVINDTCMYKIKNIKYDIDR